MYMPHCGVAVSAKIETYYLFKIETYYPSKSKTYYPAENLLKLEDKQLERAPGDS